MNKKKRVPDIGPKEDIYDNEIYPLMLQIIAICENEGINFFASFSLDERGPDNNLFCTTVLPVDDADKQGLRMLEAMSALADLDSSFDDEEPEQLEEGQSN